MVLAALSALAPLCTDLYLPVLPQLARDLDVFPSGAQLTITAVLIGLAVGQIVAGPLSDRFGRRPVLLAGLVVFAVANVASALAPTASSLIVVRLVAGLAAAATVVVTRAVVADSFPGPAAARAYASLGAVAGIAPAIAPLLGSGLSYVMGWRGMFVVLAGIAIVLLALAWFCVPESLPLHNRRSAAPAAVLGGLAACLRSRPFVAYLVAMGMVGGGLFSYISSSSFVLQDIHGLSEVAFGAVFAVNSLGLFVCANVSRRLVGRTGPAALLTVGQLMATSGAVVLLVGALAGMGLVTVLVGFFLTVASLGFISPNATALAMGIAPGGAGAAAGMLGIAQFAVGGLLAPIGGLGSTVLPLAVVLLACAVAAHLFRWTLLRGGPAGRA